MKILDKKIVTRFEFVRLCWVVVLLLALLSVLNFVSGDNYSGGLFAHATKRPHPQGSTKNQFDTGKEKTK